MLYNPSWDKPFTMPHFIGWLGKHDRAQTYNYQSCDDCLVAQYYKEHGEPYVSPSYEMIRENGLALLIAGNASWPPFPGTNAPFIRQAEWIARGPALYPVGDWTFGQALDRALEHTQTMAIA
jgi:hypothetical protein